MVTTAAGARGASEVRGAVTRELSRIFHAVMRVRLFGGTLLGTVAALLALAGEPAWKPIVLGLLAALILIVGLRDLRRPAPARYPSGAVVFNLGLILLGQLAVITTTGGIQSPFFPLLAIMALATAVATAEARAYLPVMGLVFVAAATLLAIHLAGGAEAMVPQVLRGDAQGFVGAGWAISAAVVLTGLIIASAIATLVARRAFEDAVAAASRARAEVVDAARERNRELVALSSALAHELKNPLASIQGLAGLLARKLPADSREGAHIAVLLDEAKRMGGILDEFLNFSRPVRGLAVSEVDPARLVADVGLLHEELADARGVDLAVDAHAGAALRCDPRKITQVLVNLLQNALDASPEGTTVRAAVAAAPEGGVRFTFDDEGPGLADAVRGRLFTVGATTKAAGSGLGLVIAKAIVEQHGGRLELVERDGGGCRASFWLPPEPPAGEGERGGGL